VRLFGLQKLDCLLTARRFFGLLASGQGNVASLRLETGGGHRFVSIRTRKGLRAAEGIFAVEQAVTGLPDAYRGRGGTFFKDIYDADDAEMRSSGRFRWMLSTCLAATVGAVAILIVVYGSTESDRDLGLLPTLQTFRDGTMQSAPTFTVKNAGGLKWVMPRTDRLQLTAGALSTRYIIHESSKSRRDGREYVRQKPYARIVARLGAVPEDTDEKIPAFNPFKLYANSQPVASNDDADESAGSGLSRSDVSVKVVELLGGILPGEDGQELDTQEVQDIVERNAELAVKPVADGGDVPLDAVGGEMLHASIDDSAWQPKAASSTSLNTTDIFKSPEAAEDSAVDLEGGEVMLVEVGPNDTLSSILTRAGADSWQARSMIEAAQNIFPESALVPGQEVRITLVPSLTQADKKEPARFSILSDGHDHLVTVSRNAAGEFIASAQPQIGEELSRSVLADGSNAQNSTLYAGVYYAGLMQSLAPDTIMQIMRINAFDTDFRRRVRPGDTLETFFDMKDDQTTDGPPGELLYTAINSGGSVFKFYRFRTGDGVVDYYDENGNNSKKFLMRKPVRGDDVRLTSGYGVRYHPLLNTRKMHTGVDWACAPGTPILASGNGTIEEVGHKGYYGNYIRIRHANGYHTAYGHMSKFAEGIEAGMKVRQGQTIGYVGSTGLSSGPHVHFEVLVNSRFVDPMSIQVPRERKLEGRELQDFQKERARIEELMRRAPVSTTNK